MNHFLVFISGVALLTSSLKIITDTNARTEEYLTQDTTYYYVYLGVEHNVTEEFIKTYKYNNQLVADISVSNYQEFSYIGQPSFRNYSEGIQMERLILISRKIDTLNVFKNMVITNSIRHNQGIKIAGRYGAYSVISNGDTIKTESRNLFSLVDAMDLEKK